MTIADDPVIADIHAMVTALDRNHAGSSTGDFWRSLSKKHSDLIQQYGFAKFKRTVNFEYNQWGVTQLRDPKVGALLRHFWRMRRLPLGLLRTRIRLAEISDVRWPDAIDAATGEALKHASGLPRHALVYTVYLSLLWQYAALTDRVGCLTACEEPAFGAPLPVFCRGKLISQDLALSSIEVNLLFAAIDMTRVRRVIEIGAGYGRLAYLLCRLLPELQYCIVDIPPALAISQNYLARTLGEKRVSLFSETDPRPSDRTVTALLPYQLRDYPDDYFDLVINVSSFDEMSPEEVERYFDLIDQKCRGWLYVQGYARSRSVGRRLGVTEFPYRSNWTEVTTRDHPTIPFFVERVFDLGGARRSRSPTLS